MKTSIAALMPSILRILAILIASLSLAVEARDEPWWIEELSTVHASLEKHGVHPAIIYDAEGSANVSGGERRGGNYLGNLHLQLTIDMDRLVGWSGATLFLDGLGIHGGQPSDLAGDAQGVSSIAGPNKWTLEEGWIQQNLFSNHLSILAGRYDVNSEFYRLHAADLFFNSSFGVGAEFGKSGKDGPSMFPNTALGTRVEIKPIESLILRLAIFDGVPVDRPGGWNAFVPSDGLLVVGEATFLYRPSRSDQPRSPSRRFSIGRNAQLPPYQAKLGVGLWHYTAKFPDLSEVRKDGAPVMHDGSTGAYVIGETVIYQDDAKREMRVFGQLGFAEDRVNRFGLYVGGGVIAKGFVPKRSDDEFGFAIAAARNGSHYMDAQANLGRPANHQEVALEVSYLAQVKSWLSIQPDIQYVINPDTDRSRRNALIGLMRVQLSF